MAASMMSSVSCVNLFTSSQLKASSLFASQQRLVFSPPLPLCGGNPFARSEGEATLFRRRLMGACNSLAKFSDDLIEAVAFVLTSN
jgi:hypothetical protein